MATQCNHDQINQNLGTLLGLARGTRRELKKMNGCLLRHDNEIKDINRWRNRLIGKITVITGVGGIIITIVFILINKA